MNYRGKFDLGFFFQVITSFLLKSVEINQIRQFFNFMTFCCFDYRRQKKFHLNFIKVKKIHEGQAILLSGLR